MEKKTAKQLQYEATHHRIFHEAVNLFQQKSYENVTIRDVCKVSKISIGAFYHHILLKKRY